MDFDKYQGMVEQTAIYPKDAAIIYPTLGLTGEAGEVAEKVKKVIRDEFGAFTPEHEEAIAKELGDVLWYVTAVARDLGFTLEKIAEINHDKLLDRLVRRKLGGSGDNR